jgi:hypothetical protein
MGIIARINTGGSISRATIKSTKATIVAPDFRPKPNIALSEITDVTVTGVQDGDGLVYNSITGKFEANTITATVTEITGGTF